MRDLKVASFGALHHLLVSTPRFVLLAPFIDVIAADLEALQQREALSDRAVAAALQLFMRTGAFPKSLPESEGTEDVLLRLTWLLFLAAPHLDGNYVLASSMHLQLLLTDEERNFEDFFAELRELSFKESHEEEPSFLQEIRYLGTLPTTPGDLKSIPIGKHLEEVRQILLRNHDDVLRFTRATIDSLASDIDARIKAEESPYSAEESEESLSAELLLSQAAELRDKGDLKGALSLLSYHLKENPQDQEARLERGILAATLEDLEAALEDFNALLKIEPTHLQGLLNRGLTLHSLGRVREAIQDYEQALADVGNHGEVLINRGIAHFSLQQYSSALRDFSAAIEVAPRNPHAYFQRGNLRRVLGELGHALKDYNQVIELQPDFVDVYGARGFLFLQMEDAQKAAADFGLAIGYRPGDPTLYFNRAWARLLDQDIEGAISDYDKALELDPEDVEALANRGAARVAHGDLDGALEDWEAAIEIDPYYPTAYLKRASLWIATEEREEAARDLKTALDNAPPDWPFRDEVEQTLADLLDELGFDAPN